MQEPQIIQGCNYLITEPEWTLAIRCHDRGLTSAEFQEEYRSTFPDYARSNKGVRRLYERARSRARKAEIAHKARIVHMRAPAPRNDTSAVPFREVASKTHYEGCFHEPDRLEQIVNKIYELQLEPVREISTQRSGRAIRTR